MEVEAGEVAKAVRHCEAEAPEEVAVPEAVEESEAASEDGSENSESAWLRARFRDSPEKRDIPRHFWVINI